MLRLRSRLYLEPGEIELLAEAAGREGRRLRRAGGSSLPGAAILEQAGSEFAELLADPHPPLYVIGPATKRQSRIVARRMAEGTRERPVVYARDGARGRLIAIACAGRMWPAPGYGGRDGARCYDDGQEQASITGSAAACS